MVEGSHAERIGSTDNVSVHGLSRGDTWLVIVVSLAGQDVVVLDSLFDAATFRESVRKVIPPELLDDVHAWLDRVEFDEA